MTSVPNLGVPQALSATLNHANPKQHFRAFETALIDFAYLLATFYTSGLFSKFATDAQWDALPENQQLDIAGLPIIAARPPEIPEAPEAHANNANPAIVATYNRDLVRYETERQGMAHLKACLLLSISPSDMAYLRSLNPNGGTRSLSIRQIVDALRMLHGTMDPRSIAALQAQLTRPAEPADSFEVVVSKLRTTYTELAAAGLEFNRIDKLNHLRVVLAGRQDFLHAEASFPLTNPDFAFHTFDLLIMGLAAHVAAPAPVADTASIAEAAAVAAVNTYLTQLGLDTHGLALAAQRGTFGTLPPASGGTFGTLPPAPGGTMGTHPPQPGACSRPRQPAQGAPLFCYFHDKRGHYGVDCTHMLSLPRIYSPAHLEASSRQNIPKAPIQKEQWKK